MTLTPAGRGLGLLPDAPDDRDRLYAAPPRADLPEFVDLEPDPATPPIWDQGALGSCTAHGTLACFLWASAKCGANDPMLSRLMLYWITRNIEGTADEDSGGTIRDAIKASTYGVCPEDMWPYDVEKFTVSPTQEMRDAGLANRDLDYRRVPQAADGIKGCLADGHPIDIGVTLYESFEAKPSLASGIAPMPSSFDDPIGGHCMAVWGYGPGEAWQPKYPQADPNTVYAQLRNSWGVNAYRQGYLLIPLEYLIDPELGQNYWRITNVS